MHITQILIYPVKALGAISLTQAELGITGLKWDRHWMLVDTQGRFVTQRQLPELATIRTEITADSLILRHPNATPLYVPLQRELTELTEISIWKSTISAYDEGAQSRTWLQQVIGQYRNGSLRLVRFNHQEQRAVKAKYQQQDETLAHTEFADGFPYLIASEESLTLLNQHLSQQGEATVGMERFRANIVVDKLEGAFSELHEYRLSGGHGDKEYCLAIRKPCERCPVITVDQHSGERPNPKQPLATLLQINPLEKKGAYFGGNAILLSGEGINIQVGDSLNFVKGR